MPPEGTAPITQEVGINPGDDMQSPTTMVLNYLKARGYQPTTENVRRALEANARDPGVIEGLRSGTASTEEEDQAAMAAARGGGSRNTSAAPATPPPTPGTGGTFGTGQSPVEPGPLPPEPGQDTSNIGVLAALGIPLAAAAGAYGANRFMNRPIPGGDVAPMPDVGASVPQVGGPADMKLLPAPQAQITGPGTGATDMEAQMMKALAPPSLRLGAPTPAPEAPMATGAPISLPDASMAPLPFNSQSPRTAPGPDTIVVRPPGARPTPLRATGRVRAPSVRVPF